MTPIPPRDCLPPRASFALALFAFLVLPGWGSVLEAQTLRGSQASLDRQNNAARAHDFTFLQTAAQVQRFVSAGYLVPLRGNGDFHVNRVSFPYTRPEVRLFIERLGRQYRAACGEPLVVTSLTRPLSHQPSNASSRSVHPTGMAVDFRRSTSRACRAWLERTLLSLERQGLLEVIAERSPPHYHVALYPQPYAKYVEARTGSAPVLVAAEEKAPVIRMVEYQVRAGDSLWAIARAHNTTVDRLRAENEIRSNRIYAGQVLAVPVDM